MEPGYLGEEAGQVGFVSTLQHTAGDVGQTFVVQDDQTCQVVLEMVKLAPILKEITKDLGVGRHDGSGTDDGKLHEVLTLSPRGWDRAEEYHTDVRNGKIQQPSMLVEFEPGAKTFDAFMQLAFFLEALFGRRVELVTPESLSPHIGPHILRELTYINFDETLSPAYTHRDPVSPRPGAGAGARDLSAR